MERRVSHEFEWKTNTRIYANRAYTNKIENVKSFCTNSITVIPCQTLGMEIFRFEHVRKNLELGKIRLKSVSSSHVTWHVFRRLTTVVSDVRFMDEWQKFFSIFYPVADHRCADQRTWWFQIDDDGLWCKNVSKSVFYNKKKSAKYYSLAVLTHGICVPL